MNLVIFIAAKWCENIRELNLSGMNISNKGLQTVAEKCRKLEVISTFILVNGLYTHWPGGVDVLLFGGVKVAELTGYW